MDRIWLVVIKLLVNHSTANNVSYNQLWHFIVQLYRAVKYRAVLLVWVARGCTMVWGWQGDWCRRQPRVAAGVSGAQSRPASRGYNSQSASTPSVTHPSHPLAGRYRPKQMFTPYNKQHKPIKPITLRILEAKKTVSPLQLVILQL